MGFAGYFLPSKLGSEIRWKLGLIVDRFFVVLGCHVGVIFEACWLLFSLFFSFFFRDLFWFVFGSFWGAILGRFWRPNWVKFRICDLLIFIDFP